MLDDILRNIKIYHFNRRTALYYKKIENNLYDMVNVHNKISTFDLLVTSSSLIKMSSISEVCLANLHIILP